LQISAADRDLQIFDLDNENIHPISENNLGSEYNPDEKIDSEKNNISEANIDIKENNIAEKSSAESSSSKKKKLTVYEILEKYLAANPVLSYPETRLKNNIFSTVQKFKETAIRSICAENDNCIIIYSPPADLLYSSAKNSLSIYLYLVSKIRLFFSSKNKSGVRKTFKRFAIYWESRNRVFIFILLLIIFAAGNF